MTKPTRITGYNIWLNIDAVLGTENMPEVEFYNLATNVITKHRQLQPEDVLNFLNENCPLPEAIKEIEELINWLHDRIETGQDHNPVDTINL